MSRTKTILAVGIALVTILGMTAVLAAPTGATLADGDGSAISLDSFSSNGANAADDDSGDPPESPPCDASDEARNNSEQCDEDGEEGNNDSDEQPEEPEEPEDPDEVGTCEENGAAQNNTFANEAFGTEDEEGPISSQIHENEEQFQDGEPVAHEISCGVATLDNNAAQNDSDGGDGNESNPAQDVVDQLQENAPGDDNESDDGNSSNPAQDVVDQLQENAPGDDNESDDGNSSNPAQDAIDQLRENAPDDGNESDDGEDEPGQVGTCEENGAAQNNTFANEAFGTENESGPISGQIHENEGQFQDGEPVAHEVSCGVATVDNNAPASGP